MRKLPYGKRHPIRSCNRSVYTYPPCPCRRSVCPQSNRGRHDNVYAGTGAQNPRIVTWHTDSPTKLREISLPNAAAKGFVRSITAHSGWLFVFFDGADGALTFEAYDTAAGAWKAFPWAWAPAGRVSAASGASGDIYAVWNTLGTHKLMQINANTMAAETVCLIPGTPRAISVETTNGATSVNLLCGEERTYKYVQVSVPGKAITRSVGITFGTSPFRLQTLLPESAGTSCN